MPSWSRNNAACKQTWAALLALEQLESPFSAAGALKIKDLTFFSEADSPNIQSVKRNALSNQLHNLFVDLLGAKEEDGVDQVEAKQRMRDVLSDGEKTVADLAEENDLSYLFLRER